MASLDPVTITVTLGGDPKMGLTVFFQEADSAQVATMQTGADGKASAAVHAGGFVTAVRRTVPDAPGELPDGPRSQLFTFAGVKPGDDLHLEIELDQAPEPNLIAFDLSVPDEELGRTYTLYSSCGGPQPIIQPEARRRAGGARAAAATAVTGPVTLADCGGAADMLVVSSSFDGESQTQTLHTWLYKPAVAVADGVPVALADDYQAVTDVTFSYSGIAPNISDLSIVRQLRSGRGNVPYFGQPVSPDGTTTASLTTPLPVIAGMTAVTVTEENPIAGLGKQTVVEVGGTGDYDLKFDEVALRRYASRPDTAVGGHAIAWTEDSGGAAPDFVAGETRLQRAGDDGLNRWTWQIIAPYAGQAKLTYPVLPTTIYDYNPAAQEQPAVEQLTTIKAPGGYDAVRARAFNTDPLHAITGATGRIVFEDMFEPPVIDSGAAAPRRSLFGRPAPRKR